MAIAILATGDELIYGDTLNTNTHAIAHALNSEGLSLGLQLSCIDHEQDIVDCLHFLAQKHDVIIITGGLGPTSDDRTRFALARFIGRALVEHPDAMHHIQKRLSRAKLKLNSGNRQQAIFPSGAALLPNPDGMAMGFYVTWRQVLFVLLPGPPNECLPMFNHHVLPLLQHVAHQSNPLFKWRLFGVSEGEIADVLENALAGMNCETGYRLERPYLEFKVRCKASDMARVKQIVEPLIKPHIIASIEQKASERLCWMIGHLKKPIIILDDVTGGILQTLIQRPSNHPWLAFGHESTCEFYAHLTGLNEYWSQKPCESATTRLTITYHNKTKQGSETHQIPYRSAAVVDYAAEWLCFRLFHIIDELH